MDSGLSQRAFCASKGVSLSSFCAARRRLAMPTPMTRLDDFLAIPMDSVTASGWEVELDLGDGLVLRVRRA